MNLSTYRGHAQSFQAPSRGREGWAITEYVKALVHADNADFMRSLERTQTSLLQEIAFHYQLPLDPSKGTRLAALSAVRKELSRQRRTVRP